VAKALVEFETLWHQAWLKGIEQQRSGLSAPLLVRHPESGQLLVNLDKELMQLIRCASILDVPLMCRTADASCSTLQDICARATPARPNSDDEHMILVAFCVVTLRLVVTDELR
jgi:hypothetical protein